VRQKSKGSAGMREPAEPFNREKQQNPWRA
jgi:hypothetical protein